MEHLRLEGMTYEIPHTSCVENLMPGINSSCDHVHFLHILFTDHAFREVVKHRVQ